MRLILILLAIVVTSGCSLSELQKMILIPSKEDVENEIQKLCNEKELIGATVQLENGGLGVVSCDKLIKK